VPVKSVQQQVLASLHRLRSGWMAERTARINTLRGLLRELGLIIPVGAHHVIPHTWAFLEDADSEVPDAIRPFFAAVCEEIRAIEERVRQVERQLDAMAQQIPAVERLRSTPGIGLLTSTALVGFVGSIQRFPSSRHFASYLGLTPREHSSGGKRHLGRISKQGDAYLRTLLVHGARSVLTAAATKSQNDQLRTWALKQREAHGYRKAAVALANKLARIAWAVWKSDRDFQSVANQATA
jgi:transposase